MVVTWLVTIGLIVVAQLATRRMKEIPRGLQNFVEWLIEGLYGFLEGIIGPHLVKRTFWFFATIFIFILAANWAGLVPGVGLDWLGTSDPGRIQARRAVLPRGECRRQPDDGDGARVLRELDYLGPS